MPRLRIEMETGHRIPRIKVWVDDNEVGLLTHLRLEMKVGWTRPQLVMRQIRDKDCGVTMAELQQLLPWADLIAPPTEEGRLARITEPLLNGEVAPEPREPTDLWGHLRDGD
jgi:hypothetical protein